MKQIGKTLYALNKDGSYQEWKIFVSDNTFTVHYGKENGKIQTKSTTCFGKNIGKSNETSDEEQCLLEAEAKYRDQIRKGYKENKGDLVIDVTSPMLAQDASKKPHLIKYPCTISPKLDGCRCLVSFDSDGDPIFNSRGGKEYPKHKHLVEQLKNLRKQTGFDSFDGEFYIHGLPLQNIVSLVKKIQPDSVKLNYYIFDIPSGKPWYGNYEKGRNDDLNADVYLLVNKYKTFYHNIQIVDSVLVDNEQEVKDSIGRFMEQGYEGTIIRNFNGKYEYGQRSNDLLKWKLFESDEAQVFDVEQDKNQEGVLHCRLKNGTIFKCKMKGTHEQRLYGNQLKLIGKYITFTYQQLTGDGVPSFPVGICVREVDKNWMVME